MSSAVLTADDLDVIYRLAERKDSVDQICIARRFEETKRPAGFDYSGGIVSRDRVEGLAEVLTPPWLVGRMVDLIGGAAFDARSRVLEPACGNGNFLEELYARRLSALRSWRPSEEQVLFGIIEALSSLYGIDIDPGNVDKTKERLRSMALNSTVELSVSSSIRRSFEGSVDEVLGTNVVCGDTLTSVPDLVEYSVPTPEKFFRRVFRFVDLSGDHPEPVAVIATTHYLELADAR